MSFAKSFILGNFLEELSLTEWSPWKDCSATCEGFTRRQRFCKDEHCEGEKEQIRPCGVQKCPSK